MNLKKLLDKPIAYHRAFVDIAGVSGAVMLSQALYWSSRTNDKDGWFYKTRNEWFEETGLTRYEQETARKKLRKTGILQEKLKGVPAKIYYRVDEKQLTRWLETNQLDGGKPTNKLEDENPPRNMAKKQKPTITENTTETTTENTHSSNEEIVGVEEVEVSVTGKEIALKKNGEKPVLVEVKEGVITHAEFADVLNMFKPVNPSVGRLFMNKGQTDALKRMLKLHGYENVVKMIRSLPEIVGKPYAPVITTPYQLEQKLGQLILFLKQDKNKGGGVVDARNL